MISAEKDAEPEDQALRLDQFLKQSGITPTGGQAKILIQAGEVQVNGETETRRRRKLKSGDIVTLGGETLIVPEP